MIHYVTRIESALPEAEAFAYKTEELAKAALKSRELDAEPRLPLALGAALEVRSQVLAEHNQRTEAVDLLNQAVAPSTSFF